MLCMKSVKIMKRFNETLTLESLKEGLHALPPVTVDAQSMPDFTTFGELCNPLTFNLEHNIRMPFRYHGKEKGTTIPLMLYLGLKIKLMQETGVDTETEDNLQTLSKKTRKLVRQAMIDIYAIKPNDGEVVDVAKTLQSKLFGYIVHGKSLSCKSMDDVIVKTSRNSFAAHQVSGTSTPSITIQHFLCEWLIRRARLHAATPFSAINATIRQAAKQICEVIRVEPMPFWEADSGFSRRVQNMLMHVAFSEAFGMGIGDIQLANPAKHRI